MPQRVANIAVEVPLARSGATDAGATSAGSRGARSNGKAKREGRRFSPYKKVAPGPATLLSEKVDGLELNGPISSRTRQKREKRTFVEPAAADAAKDARDASSMPGCSGDPVERQKAKEDKFRKRLAREQTSWWDSAQLAVAEGAGRTNSSLGDVSRAAHAGSLRTLARGRNNARAEVRAVDAWRDNAMDEFVNGGPIQPPAPPPAEPKELPPAEINYSPGHFDRRYNRKTRAAPLPPLRMTTATTRASASTQREAQNLANRKKVFGS